MKNQLDGTSTKGLGLPWVELKDLTKLTMGENVITNTPTQSGTSTEWKHTGLLVYNTNEIEYQCLSCMEISGIEKGVYVWNGNQWQLLQNQSTSAN